MGKTPRVDISTENEFVIKDVTEPRTINIERLDKWVVKDHTNPKDIHITLPVGTGTFLHSALQHRDWPDQHPISAITGLQEALDSKVEPADMSIIYCGTSMEVL